jgi:sec-independent protein translocase protein TatA
MFGLGFPELLLIFFIVFLLFGANKLPQLGQGLGDAIRNFQRAMKGGDDAAGKDKKEIAEPKPPQSVS